MLLFVIWMFQGTHEAWSTAYFFFHKKEDTEICMTYWKVSCARGNKSLTFCIIFSDSLAVTLIGYPGYQLLFCTQIARCVNFVPPNSRGHLRKFTSRSDPLFTQHIYRYVSSVPNRGCQDSNSSQILQDLQRGLWEPPLN